MSTVEIFAREAVAVLGRIEAILLRCETVLLRHEAQAVMSLEIVDHGPDPRPSISHSVRAWDSNGIPVAQIRTAPQWVCRDATVAVHCPEGLGVREVVVGDCIVFRPGGDPPSTFSGAVGTIPAGYDVIARIEPIMQAGRL